MTDSDQGQHPTLSFPQPPERSRPAMDTDDADESELIHCADDQRFRVNLLS